VFLRQAYLKNEEFFTIGIGKKSEYVNENYTYGKKKKNGFLITKANAIDI
jgi:hypothetical protein